MAVFALIEQNFAESLKLYRESLRLALILDDHVEMGFEMQGVAMSLSGLGAPREAVLIAGGIAADWARVGAGVSVRFWQALIDRHIGAARTQLGDAADKVWAEGYALPFEDVIRLAMTHEPRR
jgi:hypothetical protein